ncbi:DUF488 family protein [Paenibacillus aurantius]|uniref:DUF488 family protein n=1 Tax=Paenibacillus aurantius TaxID=2918900 RepID=A0AA96RF83_9BACL|nr:DUF488 family protein [Paenibacillus aurantius]WNQ10993.1 DUF488 family protein [Paenibacillus aurantius]
MIQTKRIYEPIQESDGKRILVDRLWPRGVSKEKAAIHEWMKEVAPSHELRKWFHEQANFEEFKERYRKELLEDESKILLVKQLLKWAEEGVVTLLFSAKAEEKNQAVVLAEIIHEMKNAGGGSSK